MKRIQLLRWSGTVLTPRIQPCTASRLTRQYLPIVVRQQSTASSPLLSENNQSHDEIFSSSSPPPRQSVPPSPSPDAALKSAKLAALRSRLSLPVQLPLQTLARLLVHPSADNSPQFNNHALSVLGTDLLLHYTSEHLMTTYPRLPMEVLWAAMSAYTGKKALQAMAREWGVEYAADPGHEVDPGLLQFKRLPPGTPDPDIEQERPDPEGSEVVFRRGINARAVYGDGFGYMKPAENPDLNEGVTATAAAASFVQALVGAIFLYGGRPATKAFFKEHFMSRQLPVGELFSFVQPARDLAKLCAREGFAAPVAKVISETGRRSRHPVFVVGIYSGHDKLGEGAGASLQEGRHRAAAAAMKGWYLYSPLNPRVPSAMEEEGAKPWEPAMVDPGEIIV